MSDDKAKFVHAHDEYGPWYPVDVDTPREAARDAAHEYGHEATDEGLVVLVGEPEWWSVEDIAGLLDAGTIAEMVDERVYDNVWEDAPRLYSEATDEQLGSLQSDLESVIAEFIESVGFPDCFRVASWTEWRVVKFAEEADGPKVEKVGGDS